MNTLKEYISALDAGQKVKTVIMGGLGRRYELAIQSLFIKAARTLADKEPPDDPMFGKMVVKAIDKVVDNNDYGHTGAMVGSAKNILAVMWSNGPDKAIDMMKDKDRIIDIWLEDDKLMTSYDK